VSVIVTLHVAALSEGSASVHALQDTKPECNSVQCVSEREQKAKEEQDKNRVPRRLGGAAGGRRFKEMVEYGKIGLKAQILRAF
jgi:hypothetical protein